MTLDTFIIPLIMMLGSIVIGTIGYMMRNIFQRLSELEKFPAVTEPEVRQIISDKVDPIKEDIHEIRKTIDHIFTLVYNQPK